MTMFQRVRVQLTALTVGIFVLLYGVSSAAVYGIVRHVVLQGIDARLEPVARYVAGHPADNLSILGHIPRPPAVRGAGGVYVFVHTPSADLTNAPPDLIPLLRRWATGGNRERRSVEPVPAGELYRVLYIPAGTSANAGPSPSAWVVLATDADRELHVLQWLRRVLWVVGLGGSVLAAIGGFYLAEWALRPVRKAWQQQLEFVANASHELRTPLAVIQSNLGIVLEHPEDSVLNNLEWINNAHSEARRLAKLVADLLTLARTDSEQMPVARDRVDLTALLQHIEELFDGVAKARSLTLSSQIEPGLVITGDRDRLHQLFVILLDNACKFTPAASRSEPAPASRASWWKWRTPASASPRKTCPACLTAFTGLTKPVHAIQKAVRAWACPSPAGSSTRITVGSGSPASRVKARRSMYNCRPPTDVDPRVRSYAPMTRTPACFNQPASTPRKAFPAAYAASAGTTCRHGPSATAESVTANAGSTRYDWPASA
jgi:two-component system sensor histidine kinase CiaH